MPRWMAWVLVAFFFFFAVKPYSTTVVRVIAVASLILTIPHCRDCPCEKGK